MTETVAAIVKAHRTGSVSPADTVIRCFERINAHGDSAIFISLRDRAFAAGLVTGNQEARRNELLSDATKAHAQFQNIKPFWK